MFTWRSRPHRDMTENISYMMSDADMRPPGDTLYVTGALIPLSRSEACTVIRFVNYKKHSFKKSTSYWYLILSDRWLQKQIHFRLKMIPGVPPLCAPTVCPHCVPPPKRKQTNCLHCAFLLELMHNKYNDQTLRPGHQHRQWKSRHWWILYALLHQTDVHPKVNRMV